MPELPEVETTVRGLARFLEGERITSVRVNRPDMRRPFPPDLVQALTGATVSALSRRAKYGILHTDRDHAMVFHLGMSGRWRIDPEAADKHDHLVLETEGHVFALNDPRRFGSVDLLLAPELDLWPPFAALGPEPLGADLTPEHLREATRIVAGLGNIYVCEALWQAGIHPRKAGGKVTMPQLRRLVPAIKDVLTRSIKDGGSTLRDFAQPDGNLGYFATRFHVYGREGDACHRDDGGTVRRIVQGGRSTWFCPLCQK